MKKINKVVLSSLVVGMAPMLLTTISLTSCGLLVKRSIPYDYFKITEEENGEIVLNGIKDEYLDKISSFNTIKVPKEVTSIGTAAFANDLPSNIINLTFEAGSKCQHLNGMCFANAPIKNVDFKNSIISDIGQYAFYGSKIKVLDLSVITTVNNIQDQAFSNCEELEVIKLNMYKDADGYSSGVVIRNGVFYFDKEHTSKIRVLDLSKYDEPGIYLNTLIKSGAFAGWPETGKVILSDKLSSMDVRNIAAMIATTEQSPSALQSVNGGMQILGWFDTNDYRVKEFSKQLFALEEEGTICVGPGNWLSFNEYNKESISQIGNCVELTIPSTVVEIAPAAFDARFTTLPSNFVFLDLQHNRLVTIDDLGFYGQQFYNLLSFPSTLQEIGEAAFGNLLNIEQISFNEINMKHLNVKQGAFAGMIKLRTLDFHNTEGFPDTVEEIDTMSNLWIKGPSTAMSTIENMFYESGPIEYYEGQGKIYLDYAHFSLTESNPAYKTRLVKFFADLGLKITEDSDTRWVFAKPV